MISGISDPGYNFRVDSRYFAGKLHFFCNGGQNFRKEWEKEMIHEKEPK